MRAQLTLAVVFGVTVAACGTAGPARPITLTAAWSSMPVGLGPQVAIGEQPCARETRHTERGFHVESGIEESRTQFGSEHTDTSSRVTATGENDPGGEARAVADGEVYVDTDYSPGTGVAGAGFRANISLQGTIVLLNASRATGRCGAQAPFAAPEVAP